MPRIAGLTSGGDAPGMNAALRAVAKVGAAATAALLDGSSAVTQRRVKMTEAVEGVLAL